MSHTIDDKIYKIVLMTTKNEKGIYMYVYKSAENDTINNATNTW